MFLALFLIYYFLYFSLTAEGWGIATPPEITPLHTQCNFHKCIELDMYRWLKPIGLCLHKNLVKTSTTRVLL